MEHQNKALNFQPDSVTSYRSPYCISAFGGANPPVDCVLFGRKNVLLFYNRLVLPTPQRLGEWPNTKLR